MAMSLWTDSGRRDPLMDSMRALMRFPDDFDQLFDAPTRSFVRNSQAVANTAVDVRENGKAFTFLADVPGLKKEDVKVQVENGNVLSISGERKQENVKEADNYHRVERSMGRFSRKFTLPKNADMDKISAQCANGVLTIEVPKIPPPEPQQPKTINIQ